MIPSKHGTPNADLVPLCRLWKNHNSQGFTGGIGTLEGGCLVSVWKREGHYDLNIGGELAAKLEKGWCGWLRHVVLQGRLGLCHVLVIANPVGKVVPGDLTVYLSLQKFELLPTLEGVIPASAGRT